MVQQLEEVGVFGKQNDTFGFRLGENLKVRSAIHPEVFHRISIDPKRLSKPAREGWRQLGIEPESHARTSAESRCVAAK